MSARRIGAAIGALVATGLVLWAARAQAEKVSKARKTSVRIDNSIAGCVTIEPGEPVEAHNLLLLPAKLRWVRNVGHCGCMSAILSYRVGERMTEWHFHETVHGELIDMTIRAPGTTVTQFDFVLQTDRELTAPHPFRLSFGCAAPD